MTYEDPVLDLIHEIHECREKELFHYKQMLALSGVQRESIDSGDTDALERATEHKGNLITQIDLLDRRIASLSDKVLLLTGSSSHRCTRAEHAEGSSCQLRAEIASVLSDLLDVERENQARLEKAMNDVQSEIRGADSGARAVKAYWGRPSVSMPRTVDDNA